MDIKQDSDELQKKQREEELDSILKHLISAESLIDLSVRLDPMISIRNSCRLKAIMKEIRDELGD